ncbi:MAG: outer membrane protein transport protein [Puniceicoccaceae bacterium]
MTYSFKAVTTFMCGLGLMTSMADASGFALQEQSVSGLGNAFAAGAAAAEDNSAIFSNPAALTLLEGAQIQIGVHSVTPDADVNNRGTTTLALPTQGGDSTTSEKALVPNLYYSQPMNENLVLGLGVSVPFGLATEWGNQWFGRYIADYSELQDVNIQPTLAYRYKDWLSIGVGLNYAHTSAELSNAVDMGLVFLNAIQSGRIPAAAVPASLIGDVQSNLGGVKYDGFSSIEGDGGAWGYNVGLLFQPTEQTRIGLHYRSAINVDLEGDVTFEVGALSSILGPNFPNQKGRVDLELPSISNLSVHHQLNAKWAIMADAQFTTWSSFESLVIEFEKATPPTSVVPENWEDVWRFSAGVSFQATDALKLRAGVAWDESPVPSPAYRSPRIPDSDRTWISAGLGYAFSEAFQLNAAATMIFVDDAQIDNDTHAAAYHMRADMKASVTIFSVSGVYQF